MYSDSLTPKIHHSSTGISNGRCHYSRFL